ncbi:hypothetical protein F5Y09DRAFT_115295 [Xylaria sp. FL1042]|nr:hypothetical protein F5Y09DRAFT_115295 [Xylaria sp. FL1042]
MEADRVWIITALKGVLPEQTLQLLHDHVLDPSSTFRTTSSYIILNAQRAALFLQPFVAPLAERGIRLVQDSPDMAFLALLVVLFFLALKIFFWIRRIITSLMRLALQAVLWTLVGLALMVVWNRGPEAFIADLVVLARRLVVYAAMIKDIWISEYQKYDAQTRAGAGAAAGAFGGGGSMGSGRSRSSGR